MKSSKTKKVKENCGSCTSFSEKDLSVCNPCSGYRLETKRGRSGSQDSEKNEPLEDRLRHKNERLERLSRPTPRMIRALYETRSKQLKCCDREVLKSQVEDQFCLGPEAAENYFRMLSRNSGAGGILSKRFLEGNADRNDPPEKSKIMMQRQKWLVDFSAQVAYHMCEYIDKSPKDVLVSNRLRSIADVVLERVAEVLCEPKPSRSNPGRLPRFMVAISDRIAVWIENAVYRANYTEPHDSNRYDVHFSIDNPNMN